MYYSFEVGHKIQIKERCKVIPDSTGILVCVSNTTYYGNSVSFVMSPTAHDSGCIFSNNDYLS